MKKIITITICTVIAAIVAPTGFATPPPEHKVTICHATPADTAANGWVAIEVDVASVGYQQSGHQDEHNADIIPAWSYTNNEGQTVSFSGKNLSTNFGGKTGAQILSNGCVKPTDTPPNDVNCPEGYTRVPGSTNPVLCLRETVREVIREVPVPGPTVTIYVDRPVTVEKIVERVVPVEKVVEKPVVRTITKTKTKVVYRIKYKTKTKVVVKTVKVFVKPKRSTCPSGTRFAKGYGCAPIAQGNG